MNTLKNCVAAAILLCSMAAPSGLTAAGEDETTDATVVEHKGVVEWSEGSDEGERWQPVKDGQGLQAGDQVRTGPKSRVKISLGEGVQIRLGSDSSVEIQHFEQDASRHNSIALLLGALTAKVEKAIGVERSFEVHTGTAVAGVRGTEFTTAVGLDGSVRTSVQEGSVVFEADQGTADLRHGQFSVADPEGQASTPTAVPKAFDLDSWRERCREAAMADPGKAARRMLAQAGKQRQRLIAYLERNQALAAEIDELARKARLARRSGQRQAARKLRVKLRDLVVEAIQARRATLRVATRLGARVKWLNEMCDHAAPGDQVAAQAASWIVESRELGKQLRKMKRKNVRRLRQQVRSHRRLVQNMKLRLGNVTREQRRQLREKLRESIREQRGR